MQVRQQRPPVADCFHRRSYLFMLSHFHYQNISTFNIINNQNNKRVSI